MAGEFQPARPRPWADLRLADTGMGPAFDVGRGGSVAVLVPAGQPGEPQRETNVTIVQNLFAEVERRVSSRR